MIDHALLQSNFAGRDGFVWWIGKVAHPKFWRDGATDVEEGWPFRCKVRIIGYHPFNEEELSENDLPWAHVMVPAHTGAGQACLGESSRMVGGETVFGFFLDGEEGQQPVVFGALQRHLKGPTNEKVSIDQASGAVKREKGSAFSPLSGRAAAGNGLTTQAPSAARPAATPSANADNKAGQTESDDAGEDEKEGVRRNTQATKVFADTAFTHTASNACENDSISKITHAIGSFLKTINSLTQFAQIYVDAAQNLVADIRRVLGKTTRIIIGAVKWLVNQIRDKVMCFLGKRFKDLVGLIVPEPQKSPVIQALKRIMDIVFCLLEKLGFNIGAFIKDLLTQMIGKTINTSVCAIEQALGAILAKLNDAISKALKPILEGLDWLTGALSSITGLLGQVSSYVNMIMSFLSCDSLQCKAYDDWSQGWGLSTKAAQKMSSVLDNSETIQNLEALAADGGDLGFLSMLGGNLEQFFDCNEKIRNPRTQDDIEDTIPPGFILDVCIPPITHVSGDNIKPAKLRPIVSSTTGGILSIEIINPGIGYEVPPRISVIDKTGHGGGAIAQSKIDAEGRITQIFMVSPGSGYCPTSGAVPPTPPPDEGEDDGDGTDDGSTDTSPPLIIFTTPSDDAIGVQTSLNVQVSFNEPVRRGAGVIILRESVTNDVHEIIPVDDTERLDFVSDSVIRLKPEENLKFSTEYFITMSRGSFVDFSGNKFAGIAKTDTYNFTTRGIAGLGSDPVGIVTDVVPWRPGIGYTDGDTGNIGECTFNFVLTPAGSIVGIKDLICNDKYKDIPEVTINTNTGRGAELRTVLAYSPDYSKDLSNFTGNSADIVPTGILVVDVVDCVGVTSSNRRLNTNTVNTDTGTNNSGIDTGTTFSGTTSNY